MKKNHWLWGEGTGSSLILNYFPRFQGLIPIHDNFNMDPHCIFGPIFAFLPIFILTKQQSQLQRTLAANREPTSCSFFCCYHHVLLPSGNWFTSPSVTPNWDSHIQKQHTYVLQPERNDLIKPPTHWSWNFIAIRPDQTGPLWLSRLHDGEVIILIGLFFAKAFKFKPTTHIEDCLIRSVNILQKCENWKCTQ